MDYSKLKHMFIFLVSCKGLFICGNNLAGDSIDYGSFQTKRVNPDSTFMSELSELEYRVYKKQQTAARQRGWHQDAIKKIESVPMWNSNLGSNYFKLGNANELIIKSITFNSANALPSDTFDIIPVGAKVPELQALSYNKKVYLISQGPYQKPFSVSRLSNKTGKFIVRDSYSNVEAFEITVEGDEVSYLTFRYLTSGKDLVKAWRSILKSTQLFNNLRNTYSIEKEAERTKPKPSAQAYIPFFDGTDKNYLFYYTSGFTFFVHKKVVDFTGAYGGYQNSPFGPMSVQLNLVLNDPSIQPPKSLVEIESIELYSYKGDHVRTIPSKELSSMGVFKEGSYLSPS